MEYPEVSVCVSISIYEHYHPNQHVYVRTNVTDRNTDEKWSTYIQRRAYICLYGCIVLYLSHIHV